MGDWIWRGRALFFYKGLGARNEPHRWRSGCILFLVSVTFQTLHQFSAGPFSSFFVSGIAGGWKVHFLAGRVLKGSSVPGCATLCRWVHTWLAAAQLPVPAQPYLGNAFCWIAGMLSLPCLPARPVCQCTWLPLEIVRMAVLQ